MYICVLPIKYETVKRRDAMYSSVENISNASSSRKGEHLAGSVLSVRDQEARSLDNEMRRISNVLLVENAFHRRYSLLQIIIDDTVVIFIPL